jgi:hypothetical protein
LDRTLAALVVNSSYRSGGELANLVPIIKEFCDADEYSVLSMAIGEILQDIEDRIRRPIYEEFPDLEAEIWERVNKYGRVS